MEKFRLFEREYNNTKKICVKSFIHHTGGNAGGKGACKAQVDQYTLPHGRVSAFVLIYVDCF